MSTVKAANLQNTGSGAPTVKNSSGTEVGQFAKAWIHFNGDGTVSIKDDFNFSSVTDLGVGNYRLAFTNSMSDANYCIASGFKSDQTNGNGSVHFGRGTNNNDPSTTGFDMVAHGSNNLAVVDPTHMYAVVFGS